MLLNFNFKKTPPQGRGSWQCLERAVLNGSYPSGFVSLINSEAILSKSLRHHFCANFFT